MAETKNRRTRTQNWTVESFSNAKKILYGGCSPRIPPTPPPRPNCAPTPRGGVPSSVRQSRSQKMVKKDADDFSRVIGMEFNSWWKMPLTQKKNPFRKKRRSCFWKGGNTLKTGIICNCDPHRLKGFHPLSGFRRMTLWISCMQWTLLMTAVHLSFPFINMTETLSLGCETPFQIEILLLCITWLTGCVLFGGKQL